MLKVKELGRVDYFEALRYQNYLVEKKQNGLETNYFLLLEHDHVFTMGRGADKNNILDKNISVVVTNRGGDVTYHGPGQLIGYIMVNIVSGNIDLHCFLRDIENLIIDVLKDLDIKSYAIEGKTGVWVKDKKIASIGIGVKRGITMHGFALNVNTDLNYFNKIRPCGFSSDVMTSIKEINNLSVPVKMVEHLFECKAYKYFK